MSEKIKVGNAEVDKANYDYFSLLYSKMPKEYVVADLVSKCENYDELYKSYEKIQIELQQKENIIKEVREYCLDKAKGRLERTLYDDILEILDKENK